MEYEARAALKALRQAVSSCAALAAQNGRTDVVISINGTFTEYFMALLRPHIRIEEMVQFHDWERALFTMLILLYVGDTPFVCDEGEVIVREVRPSHTELVMRVRQNITRPGLLPESYEPMEQATPL